MTLLRESNPGLERKVEELTRELKRARDHEAAVSEVLRVISGSQTNVQPVLDTVAERAAILCDAPRASVWLVEGDKLRRMSAHSREAGPMAAPDERVVPISRGHVSGRAVLERRVVHIEDIVPLRDTEYPDASREPSRLGLRALLVVPLLREGNAIGTISLGRREAGLFSKEQVALLQTFADQAVIAIENVRLFKELEARNRELTEALEQQTATGGDPAGHQQLADDVQPVFDTIAAERGGCAMRVHAAIFRLDGDAARSSRPATAQSEDSEAWRRPFRCAAAGSGSAGSRAGDPRRDLAADIADVPIGPDLRARRASASEPSSRSPMVREGQAIGAIVDRRDARSARSPTSRSSCSRPSPTRR